MDEASEDSCSFSTITTLTKTPSQQSLNDDSVDNIDQSKDNKNDITLSQSPSVEHKQTPLSSPCAMLFTQELESLMQMIQQKPSSEANQTAILETCQTLKLLHMQELLGGDDAPHDVEKLKELASRYSALLMTVDQKSRGMAILTNANNELNQYISNMEDYHTKQLGSLKAKLSLTRIVKEVQNQSLSSVDSSSSPGKSTEQKKIRKKRSSLLFWKRSSKSTSSLINDMPENSEETAQKLREKLFKKSVLIEQLRKQCSDYEQKEGILENAVHNKNIELSMKTTRMNELNASIKAYQLDQGTCYEMLADVEVVATNTKFEFEEIQGSLTEQRFLVKEHSSKMKKLDWMMRKLNEENKLLLTKLNTKNYELSCQKVQSEETVGNVKKFLLSLINMTYHDRATDQEEEQRPHAGACADKNNEKNILKSLMRILKENVTKVCKSSSSTSNASSVIIYRESGCQTDDNVIPKKSSPMLEDCKTDYSSRRKLPAIHPEMMTCNSFDTGDISKVERDSGVSIHDETSTQSLEQQIRQQRHEYGKERQQQRPSMYGGYPAGITASRSRTTAPVYKQTFKDNKEMSGEFLGYVEYMKNREIAGYKEDLKSLEKENYLLKSSLGDSNSKLKRLKHELSYRKPLHKESGVSALPMTSTPEYQKHAPAEFQRRSRPGNEIKKKNDEKVLYHPPVIPSYNLPQPSYVDTLGSAKEIQHSSEIGLDSKSNKGEDHALFMQSFEHSNNLIRGIFKEKDELQRQLDLSRQQVRSKRGVETSRMLA